MVYIFAALHVNDNDSGGITNHAWRGSGIDRSKFLTQLTRLKLNA